MLSSVQRVTDCPTLKENTPRFLFVDFWNVKSIKTIILSLFHAYPHPTILRTKQVIMCAMHFKAKNKSTATVVD
jgi:hypothetical protein